AVRDRGELSGGAGVRRWFVASFADGDTHLAEPAPLDHLVTAQCDGRRFRPLAALRGAPLEQAQICPACRLTGPALSTRGPHG
ncbi:MAG: hypothetical protein ACRDSF_25235, partial [Pseudonocardiaceae bacterium]